VLGRKTAIYVERTIGAAMKLHDGRAWALASVLPFFARIGLPSRRGGSYSVSNFGKEGANAGS
jgi:hypothetical protein